MMTEHSHEHGEARQPREGEALQKPEPFADATLLTIYNEKTAEERSCTQAEFEETFEPAGWEIIDPVTPEEADALAAEAAREAGHEGLHGGPGPHSKRRARKSHDHTGE